MVRRDFLKLIAAPLAAQQTDEIGREAVIVERHTQGKPHAGKVLAVIQPHSDDIPLFAAGTVAKLLDEGYTGYLIRVTNDDMAGPGTIATTVLANERDNDEVARVLGLKRNFNLNYGNHRMDEASRPEIKARFIFLFRLLKVDTVICYDPWSHYEENPDHYVTAASVEAACWMAGGSKDYPEHFAAGLQPHSVREKYYFGRFSQRINRVVDITPFVERKIDVNLVNLAQGPAGKHGSQLRARLAAKGQRLPLLGNDDATADREYIREFILRRDREWGKKYGVAYAEPYYYIGRPRDEVEEYVQKNARQ
jgi:LmbE family N-acetylglucosaminyl deacetylase